jgi:hypothetical protein
MPLNIPKPPTEEEAAKLAKPVQLPDGVYPARITEAWDQDAKKSGRPMIVVRVRVLDAEGNEREILVYLNASNAGLLLLRHACVACNAELKFNAGVVSAEDFPGHDVMVVIGTERKGKWPARNVILDMLPAEAAGVVPLRAAGVTPLARNAS